MDEQIAILIKAEITYIINKAIRLARESNNIIIDKMETNDLANQTTERILKIIGME